MGFLKLFPKKDPQDYEKKGDIYYENGEYGAAKMEYETALKKSEKQSPQDTDFIQRIQEKNTLTKNTLALHHKESAEELLNCQNYEDAEEKFALALELAEDPELRLEIEEKLNSMEDCYASDEEEVAFHDFDLHKGNEEVDYQDKIEEYFDILCGSMAEELAELYQGYGTDFKIGFVALNQGDFDLAVEELTKAKEQKPISGEYINLELGKAYLNQKKNAEARSLLEDFLRFHPDSAEIYQLLSECYWEQKEFTLAQQLYSNCPEKMQGSLLIQILHGEALFREEKYEEAEKFYLDYLETTGWDERIALSLALTYEALGKIKEAQKLLEEIMDSCRGCGCRIDPFIKEKYADICVELKDFSSKLIELYFSLIQENPPHQKAYYEKISQIYQEMGNDRESRRYKVIAQKFQESEKEPE